MRRHAGAGALVAAGADDEAAADVDAADAAGGAARTELVFDRPQWAVTPGQSAVVYDADVCLGGGVIVGSR